MLLTFVVAALGAFIFVKLKIPAGAFLGSMIFVAFFNVVTGIAFFPVQWRVFVRIFAGALIGSRMKRSDVLQLKTVIFPACLLIFGMLTLNLSLGFGLHYLTGLELKTALLGSAPGGVQDMALIAGDLGADPAQTAILQTVRIFAVVGFMPTLLRYFCNRFIKKNPKAEVKPEPKAEQEAPAAQTPAQPKGFFTEKSKKSAISFGRTMIFAFAGGLLVNMTGIPAGAMVGAMLATILSTVFVKPSFVPPKVRLGTMLCSGMFIGSGIGASDLIALKEIVIPALILVVTLFVANFAFGVLIHKLTGLDLTTALFASSAGGATDMALIADEMGADSVKVAVIQVSRLICVITIFPTLIKFVSSLV